MVVRNKVNRNRLIGVTETTVADACVMATSRRRPTIEKGGKKRVAVTQHYSRYLYLYDAIER